MPLAEVDERVLVIAFAFVGDGPQLPDACKRVDRNGASAADSAAGRDEYAARADDVVGSACPFLQVSRSRCVCADDGRGSSINAATTAQQKTRARNSLASSTLRQTMISCPRSPTRWMNIGALVRELQVRGIQKQRECRKLQANHKRLINCKAQMVFGGVRAVLVHRSSSEDFLISAMVATTISMSPRKSKSVTSGPTEERPGALPVRRSKLIVAFE